MRKPITIIERMTVAADVLGGLDLVPTWRREWLSRTVSGRVHVLRDVPGRLLDVLVCDPVPDAQLWALEVCEKAGKFDGAVRTRLCFRPLHRRDVWSIWLSHGTDGVDEAHPLQVLESYDAWTLGFGEWRGEFRRLRATLAEDGLSRIVGWHARRYFRHLSIDAVDDVCTLFEAEVRAMDLVGLAEANRLAERLLYRASVQEGWRKLTQREATRLGLTGAMWQKETVVAEARAARAGLPRPTGAGDWTHEAAGGPEVMLRSMKEED